MTTNSILSALEAVQSAMRAETAAQAAYLADHSSDNQAVWTAARMRTDTAWAKLWEINKDRVPDPAVSGEEWSRQMRVKSFDIDSSTDPGGATG